MDKPQRYKVQQDKGIYCLKGCDDGDLVDWGEYEALQRRLADCELSLRVYDQGGVSEYWLRHERTRMETCERHVPEGINSEHAVQGMSSPGSIHPLDDENGVRHAGNCARWHTPANSVKRTACNCGATLNRGV